MNTDYKDFIGIYTDVYPTGYCQHLIGEFEYLSNFGVGSNRQKSEQAFKHEKNDYQIILDPRSHSLQFFQSKNTIDLFFEGLQFCYDEYTNNFSTLKTDRINSTSIKMQKTSPGGGYHVWHAEHSSIYPSRVLVYMLYLNTLKPEECGETEFLYQQMRITPEENKMIIWPASFTHTHRGNLVHGKNNKYIITGWFCYE